jgi:hypothetical protein
MSIPHINREHTERINKERTEFRNEIFAVVLDALASEVAV